MSIYGQRWPHSNPADVCKSPRKTHNITRQIFCRLVPAGHETTVCCEWLLLTRGIEAMETLSCCRAPCCDKHQFCATMTVST